MTRSLAFSSLLWLSLTNAPLPAQTPAFVDPAPPKVEDLASVAPPEAKARRTTNRVTAATPGDRPPL